jgi:hypothetical protein
MHRDYMLDWVWRGWDVPHPPHLLLLSNVPLAGRGRAGDAAGGGGGRRLVSFLRITLLSRKGGLAGGWRTASGDEGGGGRRGWGTKKPEFRHRGLLGVGGGGREYGV